MTQKLPDPKGYEDEIWEALMDSADYDCYTGCQARAVFKHLYPILYPKRTIALLWSFAVIGTLTILMLTGLWLIFK